MNKILTLLLLIITGIVNAEITPNNFQNHFNAAYVQYPEIPRGILEGVAFTQTHFKHIQNPENSCIGLPEVSGVMGLTENGQGYFRNNLILVSELSGYSINAIKQNPSTNILAYASAYSYLLDSLNVSNNINNHDIILKSLSEIPWDHNAANNFALNTFVYQVLDFVKNSSYQQAYNFPNHSVDFIEIFGENNFEVLSSESVTISTSSVTNSKNVTYQPQYKSTEYAPAIWIEAPTCNYSSRNGTAISAVTIHTIQGTYAGAISWAQNCSSNVSYHYVERSSDGQVTQLVLESNKAWHVGAENPYTIGIEHDGYVSDASWYTEAMYQSSADLVRDITNSGYGINPLRTYYGVATSGVNVLGGCTKIKGHQHFPNNTHTDPGINWNWEKYYKLINNNPNITTLTTNSGSFFDTGGATADYSNDERQLYLIQPSGATSITLSFNVFDLEQDWDFMYIYDGNTTDAPLLGIFTGTSNPTTVSSSGGDLLIEFRSDCATTASGWEVSWTSVIDATVGDITEPATLVNALANWNTTDFTTTFIDNDNSGGSGVKHQLYQVIDFDGTEWRANTNNGFFSDNFDVTIHADWTQQTAAWTINNGYLQCNDETEVNSNIYALLNQSDDNVYLYHWSGQITGSGTNKRAGIHFMCSDPSLDQRGDSYMVYFRADNNKIQIYKSVNNNITIEEDVSFTINENQFYDFKIIYDKSSGVISVYIDNSLEASWIDSTPLTIGNAISMRSGNCIYDINNMKIYHDRTLSETVTVGLGNDISYQNQNPTTPSGRIKSIAVDSAYNISAIDFEEANIDWTAPNNLSFVNDGTGVDIINFTNNNSISANWSTSADANSDIASYWYAIGTTSGGTDVLPWTDNWFNVTMTHSGLSLVVGTTYYISVKAQNGAGLFSSVITTNGQTLDTPTNAPVASFTVPNTFVCSIDSLLFTNNSTDAVTYSWSVPGALPPVSSDVNPYFAFPSSGSYTVTLNVTGPGGTNSDVQTINVEVVEPPISDFTENDNIIDISFPNVTFTNTSQNANGYFWDFGDGTTSTDENPWHNYPQLGTYTVMCVAINGVCDNDTSWTTIQVVDASGVFENKNSQIKLYPNPVLNELTIELDEITTTVDLQILDSRGRVIIQNKLDKAHNIINTSDLSAGVYIVKITTSKSVQYLEIIKK